MRILGIIPARGGSKGVPGKNVRLLGGKPLLHHTAASALESKWLSRIILTTDDRAIADAGISAGLDVPFMRPPELALDTTPTLPVLQHAVERLAASKDYYDAICILQATAPFRPKGFIDAAIEKFVAAGTDSLFSVLPVPHEFNPHWMFEPDASGCLHIATGETELIPRRQELPQCYYRNGSVYLVKTSVLLQQNSIYGKTISYIESDPAYHCNIDTLSDWERAEQRVAELAL